MENEKPLRPKKRGVLPIVRAALFMFKAGPTHKPTDKENLLKGIVGGVRPMHHLPNSAPPSPPRAELFHDVLHPPPFRSRYASSVGNLQELERSPSPSPAPPSGRSRYASMGDLQELENRSLTPSPAPSSTSRYASADDLQELERSLGESDGANEDGGDGGDEAIDLKAEEFIAKFYTQMRLQRSDSGGNNTIITSGPQ